MRLIFCFEKRGVLQNIHDDNSVISVLTGDMYRQLLKQGIFSDGILPKLENALTAIHSGVREVLIGDAAHVSSNTGRETTGTLIIR